MSKLSELKVKEKPKKEYIKDLSGKDAFEKVKIDVSRTRTQPRIITKPVIRTEIVSREEIKAYIREVLKEDQKEQRIEIDPTKVFDKLRLLDPEENAYYNVIIRRTQTGRRSFLDSYVSFINRYIDELKKGEL